MSGPLLGGASEAEARTVAVKVFAVGQSFYLLNCRSARLSMFALSVFGSLWIWIWIWIWGGIAAMMAALLLFTYSSIMNALFHTAPIGIADWLRITAVGLAIGVFIGLEKTCRRMRDQPRSTAPA